MKRRDLVLGAAAGWVGAAAAGDPRAAVGWPTVRLLDGRRVGSADFAGRAVVAVFWSTTCAFCRRHNRHVERLHREAGDRLFVLGIARERDPALVAHYAARQGYTFPITLDHAPLAAVLSTRNLMPLTVTVDRQGRLVQVIPGEMFEADVLELERLA
ncbi:MAG: TlpA family protein disulfide reductase [Rubrivivax sp.]|jgi:thiol-disulfide isomerase/thioredoxin|nr:TlpA family protein disulfide reductase [Rubrivivax sp.]